MTTMTMYNRSRKKYPTNLIPPHTPNFFFLLRSGESEIYFDDFCESFFKSWFLVSLYKRINCCCGKKFSVLLFYQLKKWRYDLCYSS